MFIDCYAVPPSPYLCNRLCIMVSSVAMCDMYCRNARKCSATTLHKPISTVRSEGVYVPAQHIEGWKPAPPRRPNPSCLIHSHYRSAGFCAHALHTRLHPPHPTALPQHSHNTHTPHLTPARAANPRRAAAVRTAVQPPFALPSPISYPNATRRGIRARVGVPLFCHAVMLHFSPRSSLHVSPLQASSFHHTGSSPAHAI